MEEHLDPVSGGDARLPGGVDPSGLAGGIDQVEGSAEVGYRIEGQGEGVVVAEPQGGGVDHEVETLPGDGLETGRNGGTIGTGECLQEGGGAGGGAVEELNRVDAILEKHGQGGARGTTSADQEDAHPGEVAGKSPGGGAEPGEIGVVAANPAILEPEGVAGAGPLDSRGPRLDGLSRDLLVGNGDVSAPARPGNPSNQTGHIRSIAAERKVDAVETGSSNRGVLEGGREGVAHRVAEEGDEPGRR